MLKEVDFQKTIEDAFLAYGASIAQERAIPDVRDMLKIGLRQGLYAQYSNKITFNNKFQKAQKSVAAAMAQSYVHGDIAMYDTFIRAARPWSYRYPIEAVQGNYGNQSAPDTHAASRYVEMKANEIADYFFDGLKKNTIGNQWYNNYDDTEQIPAVFPSIGFWNIVNGCSGIAVAMATSVPTFNLTEVNNALIKIIRNPEINFDEIYCAPDFPMGGTITNGEAVKESLRNGKGESIHIKAKLEYFPDQNMIKATELPYGVFTNTVIDQLAAVANDNDAYGIDKVVDYTQKTADIRIYLSKGINPNKMIAKLYEDTSLSNWYSINMILLDNGRVPKVFGWREACNAYIDHIRICKRNEIRFDLNKALARKNIVDGLIKACSIIDEVIALIKSSSDPNEASQKLIKNYNFNLEQTKAILAMKLSSLTKLDIVKLNSEQEELIKKIEWCNYLLNDSTALDNELIKILKEVADKFGDERRTKILNISKEESEIKEIKEEDIAILLFDNNSIRIVHKDDLQGGKRGRKGTNLKPPKGTNLINTLYSTNLGTISAFTDSGKMYSFTLNDLEIGKEYSIYELTPIQAEEKVMLLIDSTSFNAYKYLITISKNGYIKKSSIEEYKIHAKRGIGAVKLEDKDKLISVFLAMNNTDQVFIASTNGNYNFYCIDEVAETGRMTKGVRAIKLNTDEKVQTATIVKDNMQYIGILTIDSSGKGKITPIEDFNETSRAIKGQQVMSLKNAKLALVYAIPASQEQLFICANNKAISLTTKSIPIQTRTTIGIKIIDVENTTAIEIM